MRVKSQDPATPGGNSSRGLPPLSPAAAGRILGPAKITFHRSVSNRPSTHVEKAKCSDGSESCFGPPLIAPRGCALMHHSLPGRYKNPKFQLRDWNSAVVSTLTKRIYLDPQFDAEGHLSAMDPRTKEWVPIEYEHVRSLIVNRPRTVLNAITVFKRRGLNKFLINAISGMVPVGRPIRAMHLYAVRDLLNADRLARTNSERMGRRNKKSANQPSPHSNSNTEAERPSAASAPTAGTARRTRTPRLGRRERAAKRLRLAAEAAPISDAVSTSPTPVLHPTNPPNPPTNPVDPRTIYEAIECARVAATVRDQWSLIELLRFIVSKAKPCPLSSSSIRAFKIKLGPCPDNSRLLQSIFDKFLPSLTLLERVELLHAATQIEETRTSSSSSSAASSLVLQTPGREAVSSYACGCVADNICYFKPPAGCQHAKYPLAEYNEDPAFLLSCVTRQRAFNLTRDNAMSPYHRPVVDPTRPMCVGMFGVELAVLLAREYNRSLEHPTSPASVDRLSTELVDIVTKAFQIELTQSGPQLAKYEAVKSQLSLLLSPTFLPSASPSLVLPHQDFDARSYSQVVSGTI